MTEYDGPVKYEKDKNFWYNQRYIQYEIVKQLNGRETQLYNPVTRQAPVRWLKCFTLEFLHENWNRYKFFQNDLNIYRSVQRYSVLPTMSYSTEIKKEQQREYNQQITDATIGYDYFIDIDNKESSVMAYPDAKKVKVIFDRYKLPYFIQYSASKGFHLIIEHQFFPTEYQIPNIHLEDLIAKLKNVSMGLVIDSDLTDLDKMVYSNKRVHKVAYSIDVKTQRVVAPLSDEQFDNFVPNDYTIRNFYNNNKLFKRGLLTRNINDDLSVIQARVKKFMDKYEKIGEKIAKRKKVVKVIQKTIKKV